MANNSGGVVQSPHLIAPLLDLVHGAKGAVYCARKVGSFIEQGGADLCRRLIDETRVKQSNVP